MPKLQWLLDFWKHWYGKVAVSGIAVLAGAAVKWGTSIYRFIEARAKAKKAQMELAEFERDAPQRDFEARVQKAMRVMQSHHNRANINPADLDADDEVRKEAIRRLQSNWLGEKWKG